jgi:hypothetical protein
VKRTITGNGSTQLYYLPAQNNSNTRFKTALIGLGDFVGCSDTIVGG